MTTKKKIFPHFSTTTTLTLATMFVTKAMKNNMQGRRRRYSSKN
jgi:hypothetical protein